MGSKPQPAERAVADADSRLNEVFAALADPVRRAILGRLDGRDLMVSEIAAPSDISLQAVSKHMQVLGGAGLVAQQPTGRIRRGRLDAGPIYEAAVWLNRYSKYWQEQFDRLAAALGDIAAKPSPRRRRAARRNNRRRSPRGRSSSA